MLRGIKNYSSVSLIESFIKIELWKCICTTNAFLRTCKCLFVFGTYFLTFKNIRSCVSMGAGIFNGHEIIIFQTIFSKYYDEIYNWLQNLSKVHKKRNNNCEINHNSETKNIPNGTESYILDFISDTQVQYFWDSNYQVLFSWHLQQ